MRIELSAIFHGTETTYRDVDITLPELMSRDEILQALTDDIGDWLDDHIAQQGKAVGDE